MGVVTETALNLGLGDPLCLVILCSPSEEREEKVWHPPGTLSVDLIKYPF